MKETRAFGGSRPNEAWPTCMVAMTRGGMGLPLPQSQAGNSPCLPLRYRLHEVVSAPRSSCDRMTQLRLERRRLITRLSRLRPRAACCISDLRRVTRERRRVVAGCDARLARSGGFDRTDDTV